MVQVAGSLLAIWMLLVSTGVQAGEIVRVRHSSTGDRTRVVLDLDRATHYTIRRVDGPERIVLELPRSRFRSGRTLALGDGRVHRVRFNDLGHRAQVVLDLPERSPYRHFALDATGDRPFRIVVDVGGEQTPEATPAAAGSATPASRSQPLHAPGEGEPYVIVIDPGHGGRDPGTRGCGLILEKDLVLSIAEAMAEELRRSEGFEVVLTRTRDRYVGLRERVEIARRSRGDLFVSIHANSARSSRAHGAEVYFLSPRGATDQAASELADRENAALMVGMDPDEDDDDVMMSILMDLQSSGILRRSGQLAELALGELERMDAVQARFIKQARFAVLRTLSMPSVLVEVGFLSNRDEARRLRRRENQQQMGRALAQAVTAYCVRYGEKGAPVLAQRRTHRVQRGETLWDLARLYDTSVSALRTVNDLRDTRIRVGQELLLP